MQTQALIQFLKDRSVVFNEGLTKEEFIELKNRFNIEFPPDLKSILSIALPVTQHFPNWRSLLNESDDYLKESLSHPIEGIHRGNII
jgi:hypothetical protein